MNRRSIAARTPSLLTAGLLLVLACGRGPGEGGEAVGDHPLAAAVARYRRSFTGLDERERQALDTFTREAGPATTPIELRRASELAGKGLADADPVTVARFVAAARAGLYQDFFRAFEAERREAVAAALLEEAGPSALNRRIAGLLRSGARYSGPLAEAVAVAPFSSTVSPRKLPLAKLLPPEDADLDTVTGSAEIVRLDAFVEEGGQPEVSVDLYRRGLRRWPGDPVLLSGLVSVYAENVERYREELLETLAKAEEEELENAAWCYLLAAHHFRVGRDEKAVEEVRRGIDRPYATLHTLARARRTVRFLEKLGYGAIQARLTVYRSADMAPYFELKDLANRALLRTREYERAGPEKALDLVLRLPVRMERQIAARPQMLFARIIGCTVAANGYGRLSEYEETRDAARAVEYRRRGEEFAEQVRALEKAAHLCSGQKAWEKYYARLGEDEFLRYLEHVLYGNEAAFLLRCAKLKSFDESLPLTQEEYPFE